MKRHTRFITGALSLLFLFSSSAAGFASGLQVTSIGLEKMNYQDKEHGWYLLKCTVENDTEESGTVSVQLRSLDKYAYYRKDFQLWGHIEAGAKSVLSLKGFMDYKTLQDIKNWEVEKIHFHD
ncbi:hypothetical protein [Desulfopila sp. IMCC35008]|uniref:hypothetical protein n=1 Tax=Desulfopila sp. IMCC35008 TaxID=2653858 RepID=UPI0013D5E7D1|nr:hypothetical protein [Desulfopila sp. IMCC35008]